MPWQKNERRWSLGTADKREAWRRLLEERDNEEKRRNGLLPPREVADAASVELNDLLSRYLSRVRETGRSEGTLKKYANMRVHFPKLGWRVLADVTDRSFYRWREQSVHSAKTKNDLLKNAQAFIRWLRRERMLLTDPLEFVEPVMHHPGRHRRYLTEEEFERLLNVASPERSAVYFLAGRTGLRRKEIQSLTLADFEFDTPAPFVRVPASVAKNRKEATRDLIPRLVEVLRSILPADTPPGCKVFAGMVPRLPRFKKDLEAAGISFVDDAGQRIDFHALRVTYGQHLLEEGTPLPIIQQAMGHSDIRTTMKHYCDAARLRIRQALVRLPVPTIHERGNGAANGAVIGAETGVAASPIQSQSVAQPYAG